MGRPTCHSANPWRLGGTDGTLRGCYPFGSSPTMVMIRIMILRYLPSKPNLLPYYELYIYIYIIYSKWLRLCKLDFWPPTLQAVSTVTFFADALACRLYRASLLVFLLLHVDPTAGQLPNNCRIDLILIGAIRALYFPCCGCFEQRAGCFFFTFDPSETKVQKLSTNQMCIAVPSLPATF